MTKILTLLLCLIASPALAIFDNLCTFQTEADAQADPALARFWRDGVNGGGWDASRVIAHVQVWQPINDTMASVTDGDGLARSVVRHQTDGNFWLAIATDSRDAALEADAACVVVTDRDAANAGQPFIVKSNLTTDQLAAYQLQPTFAGSNYPFGAPR